MFVLVLVVVTSAAVLKFGERALAEMAGEGYHVQRERLSVRQRMSDVLGALRSQAFVEFIQLFRPEEGRMGVTVTFCAKSLLAWVRP